METQVTVLIKDMNYKVIQVDAENKYLQSDNPNEIILGKTMVFEQQILIRKDLQPNRKFNVLVHEITHAFIDVYGYTSMDKWNEEQLCSFNESFASDIVSLANEVLKKLV